MTDRSSEEDLENLLEQLQRRQRERQQKGRGRGANRQDRRMVEDVAREKGMDEQERREFGDYIEDIKRGENRGGDVNFTYEELLDIADEFLDR